MKKLITVVFSVCMVLSIVFSGCAGENNAASYAGYAYDLHTMEEIADLDNVSIDQTDNAFHVSFMHSGELYDMNFEKVADGNYECYFSHNGKSFYSVMKEKDNFYAGLVRDITEIVNSETLQFGFVISDSISQLDRARNAMESIVPSEN